MDDWTIKRAMLGDHEAAERMTERGIEIPCPCCGGRADSWEDTGNNKGFVQCIDCELIIQSTSKAAAIAEWNTRAPILSAEEMEMLEGME